MNSPPPGKLSLPHQRGTVSLQASPLLSPEGRGSLQVLTSNGWPEIRSQKAHPHAKVECGRPLPHTAPVWRKSSFFLLNKKGRWSQAWQFTIWNPSIREGGRKTRSSRSGRAGQERRGETSPAGPPLAGCVGGVQQGPEGTISAILCAWALPQNNVVTNVFAVR